MRDREASAVTTIAFFNNKGGVGKTSLVYHLAWMYAELGLNTLAADLDPQSNLTGMFFDEERLEALWQGTTAPKTVFGAFRPLLEGRGDVVPPHVERPDIGLGLVVGDLQLARAEDELSSEWPRCLDGHERAFRVLSALWRILRAGAAQMEAQVVLLDVGPNLGAFNRAALIAADHVVVPLAPDLFSFQGLRNLGPTLRKWRGEWKERLHRSPISDLDLPGGGMNPLGYVVMQHAVRLDRPVQAYGRWMARIPAVYGDAVVSTTTAVSTAMDEDPHCLATLRHYRSLMPLAQEARKPMFALRPADGAIGGHAAAVERCRSDFGALARRIARGCGVDI